MICLTSDKWKEYGRFMLTMRLALLDRLLSLVSFLNKYLFLFQIKDILKPEIMEEIVMETRQRLLEQEG